MISSQLFREACIRDGETVEKLIRRVYRHLPNKRTFIDGGAHLGYHTIEPRLAGFRLTIAIEASPSIFGSLIARQISLNSSHPNLPPVVPVCAALGHRARQGTTVEFHHSTSHPGRSTINRDLWEEWSHGGVRYESPVKVALVDIDDLKAILSPQQPVDFIKLDLEGNEINALRGGASTLAVDRPAIAMEFGMQPAYETLYGETCRGFIELMEQFEYILVAPWGERAEELITSGYPFNYVFAFPREAEGVDGILSAAHADLGL